MLNLNAKRNYYHYPNRYDIWITEVGFNGHISRKYERHIRGKRPIIIAWTCKAACNGLWDVTLRMGKTLTKRDCKDYRNKTEVEADNIINTFINSLSDRQ